MDFYSMEQFEIMGDAMEEVAEWEAYEADMAEQSQDNLDNWMEEMEKAFN